MEDRLIHSLALNFANWLNKYSLKEGNAYLRVVYGTEVMIMNITKLIIILLVTVALGSFVQTIAVMAGFNVIRRWAFGLHAKSSTSCTVGSLLLFVAVPHFLKGYVIGNLAVLPIFCAVILSLLLYAPADTESRPLVGEERRAKLKRKAVLAGIAVMLAVLFIRNSDIKTMVCLGAVYEAVSVWPLTYKLFKRRSNNYERFEREGKGAVC